MENINIPLVDVLSEMMGERIVMSGSQYVGFDTKVEVSQDKVDEALNVQSQKLEKLKQEKFRKERNMLLDKLDKAINKLEDIGQDSSALRKYRQDLRDATINWVMPDEMKI